MLLQNETNLVGSIIARAKATGTHDGAQRGSDGRGGVFRNPLELLDWLIVKECGRRGHRAVAPARKKFLPALERAYPHLNVLLTLGERGFGLRLRRRADALWRIPRESGGHHGGGRYVFRVLPQRKRSTERRFWTRSRWRPPHPALCVQVMGAADSIRARDRTLSAVRSGELGELLPWGGWR